MLYSTLDQCYFAVFVFICLNVRCCSHVMPVTKYSSQFPLLNVDPGRFSICRSLQTVNMNPGGIPSAVRFFQRNLLVNVRKGDVMCWVKSSLIHK